jgi:hypothetical protein
MRTFVSMLCLFLLLPLSALSAGSIAIPASSNHVMILDGNHLQSPPSIMQNIPERPKAPHERLRANPQPVTLSINRTIVALSPNPLAWRVTNEIEQLWDTLANEWQNNLRQFYTYDDGGNQTQSFTQNWKDGGWNDQSRNRSFFNEIHQETSYVYETWNDPEWVVNSGGRRTYDVNGNVAHSESQYYTGGVLTYGSASDYAYDENGRQTSQTYATWMGGVWSNQSRNLTTYDGDGDVVEYLSQT